MGSILKHQIHTATCSVITTADVFLSHVELCWCIKRPLTVAASQLDNTETDLRRNTLSFDMLEVNVSITAYVTQHILELFRT